MTVKTQILNLSVFLCGAIVMIFEIIGSRIVTPYIGGSIYIWTSLIGVILGSLSLGYWLGGRFADRKCDIRALASVIFGAGACVSATTLIKDVLLSSISSAALILEIKAIIASLFLFAPASVFLGMVTPYAVRLKMSSVDESGRTVGNLYALSTVGSIVGTFSAGFFLVPFVGSVRTLYIIAAALFAIAIAVFPLKLTASTIASLLLLVFGITFSELMRYYLHQVNELVDIDTEYSRVQVFRTSDPDTGRPIRAFATDPYFAQSAIFYDTDELVFKYARFYDLVRHFNPDFQHALMLGGGGFSYPKYFIQQYPNASMDVVEIDPRVEQIARDFFRLQDNERLRIFHEDGRVFLNNAPPGMYDALMIDAFGSLFSVPYQLTTRESVEQMSRVLNERGVVIANIGASLSGEASHFLQAEFATYQAVFPNVFVFKVRSERLGTDLQNLILVATKVREPFELSSPDPELNDLLKQACNDPLERSGPVITDELAPVDYYNSLAQRHFMMTRN